MTSVLEENNELIETDNPKVIKMKKIKAKKRTLEEFKNWLEGLHEFQEENWIPNSTQWALIKASINAIKEPIEKAKQHTHVTSLGPSGHSSSTSAPPSSLDDIMVKQPQYAVPVINQDSPVIKQELPIGSSEFE